MVSRIGIEHMSNYIDEVMKTHREIEHALEKTVRISSAQVTELVVNDLAEKYRYNIHKGNTRWAAAFYTVLRYYLTQDEMDALDTLVEKVE